MEAKFMGNLFDAARFNTTQNTPTDRTVITMLVCGEFNPDLGGQGERCGNTGRGSLLVSGIVVEEFQRRV